MTENGTARTRLEEQVERLSRNCEQRAVDPFELGVRWSEDGREIDYLYRKGQLLCDQGDRDVVLAAFDAIGESRPLPDQLREGAVGLLVIDTAGRDADDLARRLSAHIGDDQVCAPTYVLDTQARSNMCPATDPLPWTGPVPVWPEPVGARAVEAAVIDTGFAKLVAEQSGFERFAAVREDSEIDDELFFGDSTDIRPYGGHGTATTACLLATAGGDSVRVQVRDCLVGGGADELTIVEDLEAVVRSGVDVVSLQAGFYTRGNREPRSFVNLRRHVLSQHPRTVVVAAAGNDGSDRPFWPAAFGWATAVGALTKGGDARARWTNLGHWVDVYATGENVVVPFANGTFTYTDGTRAEFSRGHALWSGTSFATPYVAGAVVRRMVERDLDARMALAQVLSEAADAALPGTGPRLVV